MARIELTGDSLIVHVEGFDKLWALRSRLEVPLAHVRGAEPAEEQARKWLQGLRLGGTHIPGLFTAGTFYQHGELLFWDVADPAKAVGIDLEHERYRRLVVQVDDPAAVIAAIEAATRQDGVS